MDHADLLKLATLVEDPDRWEAMIRREQARARTDTAARAVVESIYCDEDRAAAFDRFRRGAEFRRLLKLLRILGVRRDARICEIGGGGGWLGWALYTSGFHQLEMLEPNSGYVSGTGYLRTRADSAGIRIWNDLDAFYADSGRFDLILSHNCVHHFRGIAYVAACLRQKLVEKGRWLMVREWYAESAEELYRMMAEHPYSQKYGVYEFPQPGSHYVEAAELVGFDVEAVIPARYANGVLDGSGSGEGGALNRSATKAVDVLLEQAPATTQRLYSVELFANRYLGRRLRYFTRPQAVAFRRRTLTP